jgi:glycosyltransferase involved in cell wall biosynthesis
MRLRILNYPWHVGHQYELHRLPHDFVLLVGEGFRRWNFRSRPLQPNVSFAPAAGVGDGRGYDLAILHFDEEVLRPSSSAPYPFRRLFERLRIPIIALCHGPAPFRVTGGDPAAAEGATSGAGVTVDEEKRLAVVDLIGDRALVVANSHQAAREWRFPRACTIWHGLDPADYPQTTYEKKVLTVINSLARKPVYQGYDLYKAASAGLPCDYLGKDPECEFHRVSVPSPAFNPWRVLWNAADFAFGSDDLARGARGWRRFVSDGYARSRFGAYRDLIARYSAYFNPTRLSPMPRSRLEALFCGLALVTTFHHDVEMWLEDGVTGFASNDPAVLRERLRALCADPALCRRLGRAGREMAHERFHVRHYLARWQEAIAETMDARR